MYLTDFKKRENAACESQVVLARTSFAGARLFYKL